MKLPSFRDWDKRLLQVVERFPIAIIICIVYAFFEWRSIQPYSEGIASYKIGDNYHTFFIAGFFLSVAASLFSEDKFKRWFNYLINIVVVGLWLWFCSQLPEKFYTRDYIYTQVLMFGVSFFLSMFFVSHLRKGRTISFWNFSINLVFKIIISVVFAGVLMGGISLALVAIDHLFKVDIDHLYYERLAVFCFILFGPVYFMSNIPAAAEKQNETIQYNKFLKIFGLYIVLPVLSLYTAILYAYLAKILFIWQLPNGWVSWLVSVLGVAGFLTVFLIHPVYYEKQSKLATIFSRYFPFVMIPLLMLMTVGILRRYNDYGWTINRLLVIILNLWMYGVAIYLITNRSRGIKTVFVSFALIAFLAAIGPWSVFNIARRSVFNQLEQTFQKHHLLTGGKVDFKKLPEFKIDSTTAMNTQSALFYLNNRYGIESIQPLFKDSLKGENIVSIYELTKKLGLEQDDKSSYQYFNFNAEKMPVSPENFKNALFVNLPDYNTATLKNKNFSLLLQNDTLTLKQQNSIRFTILLSKKILELKGKKDADKSFNPQEIIIRGENYKLMIYSIDGSICKNINISNLSGILFY